MHSQQLPNSFLRLTVPRSSNCAKVAEDGLYRFLKKKQTLAARSEQLRHVLQAVFLLRDGRLSLRRFAELRRAPGVSRFTNSGMSDEENTNCVNKFTYLRIKK